MLNYTSLKILNSEVKYEKDNDNHSGKQNQR